MSVMWHEITEAQLKELQNYRGTIEVKFDFGWFRTTEGKPYTRYWMVVRHSEEYESVYIYRSGLVVDTNPHDLPYEVKQNMPEEEHGGA